MNLKEIRELIDFLIEKDIAEFELERGDVKVRIRRGSAAAAQVQYVTPVAAAPAIPVSAANVRSSGPESHSAEPQAESPGLHTVKSPIVGTFFESPSPGSPAFVKPGDLVTEGQVLCIVEAMKLMNEIEADASGVLEKILVTNGQPVEYGQPMFQIRTAH